MEVSDQYSSSHHSLPSPDNLYIANLHGTRLQIRSTSSLEVVHTFTVPQETGSRFLCLRWSPKSATNHQCNRILVADEDNVRAWDLRDHKWTGTINNGSGGMGKIVNADFGAQETELLTFSDFGAKVNVWSLNTGKCVEIRDPKHATTKGYGYRPSDGILALLSRPNAQDTLTLHAPQTYSVLKTVTLNTIDAQGLKWSLDGRWLAVWDTPSVGCRVYIYTADGQLYRMYSGDQESDIEGLGIRIVEWSPRGDYLVVGGYDKRVTLLSTRTFSPVVFLDHTASIQLSTGGIWEESVSASGERRYNEIQQPVTPPIPSAPPGETLTRMGISSATFNCDGTMIATRDEATPTAVWIWDLSSLSPKTVLIQHSPVKQLTWHPSDPDVLLIQCNHEEPVINMWRGQAVVPEAMIASFKKSAGRLEARWLNTARDRKPGVLFGDAHGYCVVWPLGRDSILRFDHPESPDRADDTDDSLFDILTGRTPVHAQTTTTGFSRSNDFDDTTPLEDTFRHKKALDDNLDESFF